MRNYFVGFVIIFLVVGISELFGLSFIWSAVVLLFLSVLGVFIKAYVGKAPYSSTPSLNADLDTKVDDIKEAPEDKSFDIE